MKTYSIIIVLLITVALFVCNSLFVTVCLIVLLIGWIIILSELFRPQKD